MNVPPSVRRSVIFIGEIMNGKFIPRATGFFVTSGEEGSKNHFPYLITAEHVIVGMVDKGKEIFARFNMRDGLSRVESLQTAQWWYHPNSPDLTDVAITAVTFDWNMIDHECVPLFNYDLNERAVASGWALSRREIGLGDETFAIGLFRSHYGAQRNIPIIRIGNISAMPEEPIKTRHGSGFVEGYLVEMRSIAGLSGSPVFVPAEELINPKGPIIVTPTPLSEEDERSIKWSGYVFLGLIHGHFDVASPIEDIATEDDETKLTSVNTGIGIVIPAKRVLETLYQPDLNEERQRLLEQIRQSGATPDADA